ncbi:glutathione S-transferase family protein [Shewanella sp. NIFS-20-20]|uniref:glutathione S-transferase family protein n=1 Tax=Shewanella sp. NIFS-20-20 TaxID=2853806 RepID=UPI001C44DB3F|nr:glutathione S-transferase family protein [Shewanella sp. NIFS-20-20]MBV7316023.1 glutathione S-transferase family protein [Shewanella sp. NIFS-20-20]
MDLYYHPLSRYSQKVLIALYEKQANFYPRIVDLRDPLMRRNFQQISPNGMLPLLRYRQDQLYPESSIIIEFLDQTLTKNTQFLPRDKAKSLQIRLWDRLVDAQLNHVLYQYDMNILNANQVEQQGLIKAIRQFLVQLDKQLTGHHWLCSDSLSLADCALIPCINHPLVIREIRDLEHLSRYRQQVLTRGAWMLVSDEIAQAQALDSAGMVLFPQG